MEDRREIISLVWLSVTLVTLLLFLPIQIAT